MTHEQPSQPNTNYGDGLSIAFELVATPAVFGLLGVGLDRWLGTAPLFVLLLAGAAFATVVGLTIWRYGIEMERHDHHRRSLRAERGPRPPRWERSFDHAEAEVSL